MKKLLLTLLTVVLLCTNVQAQYWENLDETGAQPVDLIALSAGLYTSASTITGSVSAIPLYGNFEGRRNLTITNSSDLYHVFIMFKPNINPVDEGYRMLAGSTLSMDISDNATNSTVYISTSHSTISVSVSTIEIR